MKTYATRIEIKAPPERVWYVLTQDLPRDPEPFGILRLDGAIAPGGRIKLWSEVAPKRAFTLTVIALDPPKQMVWRGGMPLGLFTGTRTFDVTSQGNTTVFAMREVFAGPLSTMIVRSMPDLTPSFETFANTLKEKAETHE